MKRVWLLNVILLVALCAAGAASALEVAVYAGSQDRAYCPVTVTVDEKLPESFWLQAEGGDPVPCLAVPGVEGGSELRFIVTNLKKHEKRVYKQVDGGKTADPVKIDQKDGQLDFSIGGKPFTNYLFVTTDKQPRPIFYPVIGPDGVHMTRGYPMDPQPGEAHDHPHHESLWVAHGDVNGVDFWMVEDHHGYQRHAGFDLVKDGPACGFFSEQVSWQDENGKKILDETRRVTIWGTPEDARMIDYDMTFKPVDGDVKFGDTKEGGLVSLRVAHTMREVLPDKSKGTGKILNAYGQTGMKEAWGQPAPWCDYSGPVGGITAGMTIMDYPDNLFYPTRYHVRDYGLFTANPFGLSHFIGKGHDGSQVLKQGETWRQRYRIYIHRGDSDQANVQAQYDDYADGPRVIVH